MAELSPQYGVYSNMITRWQQALLALLPELFAKGKDRQAEGQITDSCQRVGPRGDISQDQCHPLRLVKSGHGLKC